jgi:hypothetical protein
MSEADKDMQTRRLGSSNIKPLPGWEERGTYAHLARIEVSSLCSANNRARSDIHLHQQVG